MDPRTLLRSARGVYLVLTQPRIPHVALARAAVGRDVPAIQLREKELPDDELLRLARSLREATRGSRTLFIVNDRPDIAVATGADGVHVGPSDAGPGAARRVVGDAIVGVSVRTPDEARAAVAAGADYVGAGPVFPTATKPDAAGPIGIGGLAGIAAAVDVPVAAIGGIDAGNAEATIRAGARLVAVVSAVGRAANPFASLETLIAAARPPVMDVDGQANHDDLKHCPRCASLLSSRDVRGHVRPVCPACGYIAYRAPAPVTCVLVERDGALLLVRRRYPPGAGRWCIPAGFIEPGEAPEASATREVREETGLDIAITGVFDTWATTEDPRTPVVCIAYTGTVQGGVLVPGDDAAEAAFFAEGETPPDIAFTTHRAAIVRYWATRRRDRP